MDQPVSAPATEAAQPGDAGDTSDNRLKLKDYVTIFFSTCALILSIVGFWIQNFHTKSVLSVSYTSSKSDYGKPGYTFAFLNEGNRPILLRNILYYRTEANKIDADFIKVQISKLKFDMRDVSFLDALSRKSATLTTCNDRHIGGFSAAISLDKVFTSTKNDQFLGAQTVKPGEFLILNDIRFRAMDVLFQRNDDHVNGPFFVSCFGFFYTKADGSIGERIIPAGILFRMPGISSEQFHFVDSISFGNVPRVVAP
ncbi:hypothetical protein [Ancylobacter oerskovii]|uniref:Uncharacterized protein n=1 Tax=Ancylobacter oerskovii TaxID=459519 RepID=A0ABW4Z3S6_9HYPH|nr:hypothetical protein [Ancylobacter oerskovii]MBS7546267.1 hypothetical protein [Ancylobacter oerskovii]